MCMAGNPLNSEKCAADKPSDYDSSWTSESCPDSSCSYTSGTETDDIAEGLAQVEDENIDDVADQIGAVEDENTIPLMEIWEQTEGWIDSLGTVWDQTEDWIDSLGTFWDKTAEAVSDAWDKTAEAASDAYDTAKEAASDAYDTAKEAASDAYDWTAEWAEEVANELPQVEAESVYDDWSDCYRGMLC